ncbi:hypothetical protein A6P39_001110 [Streptomyces sp. FXJ1.172]|uniref:hypothetical protein n=1 Tax=Streptomyces sp. FXJ1.172 TaxID=710705 RepID=UPI0007D03831|nr:hypothetical protein [Streptomyces sp. FXJ1.172]WEO92825.1 hypothetical protein A6P39_001110 [Streptomyces sp. FXJ1.172]
MQQFPIPCPAHLTPDATGTAAFHAAYRQAMAQQVVFVAIESERRLRWSVKADALTAGSGHTIDEAVNDAVRAAIMRLVRNREIEWDAYAGPVYVMMHGVRSEERARELAAAFHAALYGDLQPLARAVPGADPLE